LGDLSLSRLLEVKRLSILVSGVLGRYSSFRHALIRHWFIVTTKSITFQPGCEIFESSQHKPQSNFSPVCMFDCYFNFIASSGLHLPLARRTTPSQTILENYSSVAHCSFYPVYMLLADRFPHGELRYHRVKFFHSACRISFSGKLRAHTSFPPQKWIYI
jgi:hypothetical protein